MSRYTAYFLPPTLDLKQFVGQRITPMKSCHHYFWVVCGLILLHMSIIGHMGFRHGKCQAWGNLALGFWSPALTFPLKASRSRFTKRRGARAMLFMADNFDRPFWVIQGVQKNWNGKMLNNFLSIQCRHLTFGTHNFSLMHDNVHKF